MKVGEGPDPQVMDYDRVVVMAAGRVVEEGVPQELAACPASAFFAMRTAEERAAAAAIHA